MSEWRVFGHFVGRAKLRAEESGGLARAIGIEKRREAE